MAPQESSFRYHCLRRYALNNAAAATLQDPRTAGFALSKSKLSNIKDARHNLHRYLESRCRLRFGSPLAAKELKLEHFGVGGHYECSVLIELRTGKGQRPYFGKGAVWLNRLRSEPKYEDDSDDDEDDEELEVRSEVLCCSVVLC